MNWKETKIKERLFKKTPLQFLSFLAENGEIINMMDYCRDHKTSYQQFIKYRDYFVEQGLIITIKNPSSISLKLTAKGKKIVSGVKKFISVLDDNTISI